MLFRSSISGGSLKNGAITADSYTVSGGTISVALNGSGAALTKTGAGEAVLGALNGYAGPTTVSLGKLSLAVNGALSASADLSVGGGELALGTTAQTAATVVLSSGSITGGGLTATNSFTVNSGLVSSVLSGAVTLTKETAGEVVLSNLNTYSGQTTVNAGKLTLSVDGALYATSTGLVVSGGELALGTTSQTATNVTLSGGSITGGTLTATAFSVSSGTISSVLGGGPLTMNGASQIVTLSGANTYTGAITVSAGVLKAGSANAFGPTSGGGVSP